MSVKLGFQTSDLIKSGRISQLEVDTLQELLKKEHINTLSDQQLATFIISCERNLQLAKKAAVAYIRINGADPETFLEKRLEDHYFDAVCAINHFNIVPRRTQNNDLILIYRLHSTDTSKFSNLKTMQLFGKMISAGIYLDPPNGLIILCDTEAVTFQHLFKLNLGSLKKYIQYCQEAMAVKLKVIHFMNASYFLHKALSIAKPLMNDHFKSLIFTHPVSFDQDEFSKKYVEKDCLPLDYGGNLPSIEELHLQTMETIKSLRSFYDEEEKQIKDAYELIKLS